MPKEELDPVCRTSGNRVVVVYSHRIGDETPVPREKLRSIVRRMNWKIADQSSLSSSGSRVVRMATDCDEGGEISVYDISTSDNSVEAAWDATVTNTGTGGQLFGGPSGGNALKYLLFDSEKLPGYAGLATRDLGIVKSRQNASANASGLAVVYAYAGWEDHTAIHELFHTLGAVQSIISPIAPFSSWPYAHCIDGLDVMCYDDGGKYEGKSYADTYCTASEGYETPVTVPIDCHKDTYFNAAPKAGTWLAEHWDLAGPEDPFLVTLPTQPPEAETEEAKWIRADGAMLRGTVTPNADYANFYFEYGPTEAYGTSAPAPKGVPGWGEEPTPVSEPVWELDPQSTYHYRVVAENDLGEKAYGEDQTFETVISSTTLCKTTEGEDFLCSEKNRYPVGTSLEASPEFGPYINTSVGGFECYGSSVKGKTTAKAGMPLSLSLSEWSLGKCYFAGAGEAECTLAVESTAEEATLTWSPRFATDSSGKLTPGGEGAAETWRLKCSAGPKIDCLYEVAPEMTLAGSPYSYPGSPYSYLPTSLSVYGFDLKEHSGSCPEEATFEAAYEVTAPKPLYVVYGGREPMVSTGAASEIGVHSATLDAEVNPEDPVLDSEYHFEYDTSEYKAGEKGPHGASAPIPDATIEAGAPAEVSETLEGLAMGTTYHYRVVASNEVGTAYGEDKTFETTVETPIWAANHGNEGTASGQFDQPYGVAVDEDGDLWVADDANHRTQKLSPSGRFLLAVGKEVNKTKSEKAGTSEAERNLCTAASGDKCGKGTGSEAAGMAVDPEGDVWVVESTSSDLKQYGPQGEYLGQVGTYGKGEGQINNPRAVAFDAAGDLLIADQGNNRIVELSQKGSFLDEFGSKGEGDGHFESPSGVTVDPGGHIWVADKGNDRVQEFDAKGEFLAKYGSSGSGEAEFQSPYGIATDSHGAIWVADSSNDRIEALNGQGEYMTEFGEYGTGNGQLHQPKALAFDPEGDIWVADTSNDRIQQWVFAGKPKALTEAATEAGPEEGTLNATINPKGSDTGYSFEYGPTTSYGASAPVPDGAIGSGTSPVAVSQPVGSLTPSTTYHYRVVASNADGTRKGADQTFTTGAALTTLCTVEEANSLCAEGNRYPAGEEFSAQGENVSFEVLKTNNEKLTLTCEFAFVYGQVEAEAGRPLHIGVSAWELTGNPSCKNAKTGQACGDPTGLHMPFDGSLAWTGGADGSLAVGDGGSGKPGLTFKGSGCGFLLSCPATFEPTWTYEGGGESEAHLVMPEATMTPGSCYGVKSVTAKPATYVIEGEQPNYYVAKASTVFASDFGGKGSTDGKLNNPTGIAIDSSANIWVADGENNRVQKFSSEGKYVSKFGSKGSGDGQFEGPNGIAIDSKGNIWVTDTWNNRVQEFDSSGKFKFKFGKKGAGKNGEFELPTSIAIDSSGDLWVVDMGNHRVQEFSPEGKYMAEFGTSGTGNGQFQTPYGIAIDSKGDIWVTDTAADRVQEFSPEGKYVSQFGKSGTADGQFVKPSGIAIDAWGNIWVTDFDNHRVQHFNPAGEYRGRFGAKGTASGKLEAPLGIAIDSSGSLWVGDAWNDRVSKWIR